MTSKPTSSTKTTSTETSDDTPKMQAVDAPKVEVRRKEMVERIAASTGVKPNLIKSVLDGVLKEIGDALSNGESLNLNPLGKMRVNRQKDIKNGEVLICKLRRKTAEPEDTDAVATAAE